MNLATFIELRQPSVGVAAAPTGVDPAAWDAYLSGIRSSLNGSFDRMIKAYRTLRSVREGLGLPFVVTGEGVLRGALTPDSNQQYIEAATLVDRCNTFIDDARAGRRELGFDDVGNLVIGALPTDGDRIVVQNGAPVLVDQEGKPLEITGSIGLAPFAIVAIVAVVAIGAVLAVEKVCDTLTSLAEEKTNQTVTDMQRDLVQKGKATPEQAKAMADAVYDGARGLEEAKAKTKDAGKGSDFSGTIKTVVTGGIVIAGIYLVAQLVPMFARRTPVAA